MSEVPHAHPCCERQRSRHQCAGVQWPFVVPHMVGSRRGRGAEREAGARSAV